MYNGLAFPSRGWCVVYNYLIIETEVCNIVRWARGGSWIRVEYVSMQKKLTITLDEKVYAGLHRVIGRGKISQFIEGLVRPHVDTTDLEASYRELAQSEMSDPEASEWVEGVVGDVGDMLDEAW